MKPDNCLWMIFFDVEKSVKTRRRKVAREVIFKFEIDGKLKVQFVSNKTTSNKSELHYRSEDVGEMLTLNLKKERKSF